MAKVEAMGEEMDDFVSAPRAGLEKMLLRMLPLPEDALIPFQEAVAKAERKLAGQEADSEDSADDDAEEADAKPAKGKGKAKGKGYGAFYKAPSWRGKGRGYSPY